MTKANPYNAKKDWHGDDVTDRGPLSADDSLFYRQPPTVDEVEESDDEQIGDEASHPDDEPIEQRRSNAYRKHDYKKRYDDLKRHHDRKLAELKSEMARLEAEARAGRPTYTPPKTPEELATFKEDNPDVYGIVETVAHMQSEAQLNELREEIKRLKTESKKAAHGKAKAELLKMHPDFEDIVKDDKFHEWASNQPEQIQEWIYRNGTNAVLAARAIDLYKKDAGHSSKKDEVKPETNKPKRPKPTAADTVSVGRRAEVSAGNEKVWTQSEIARLSLREYEKHRDEIDEAWLNGRVIKG